DSLGFVGQLYTLSDGRVVINDPVARQIIVFDSTLQHRRVIADTLSDTHKAYGSRGGALFLAPHDTLYFVDAPAQATGVIAPHGTIGRTLAFPRPADARMFGTSVVASLDDRGARFVYQPFNGYRCHDGPARDSNVIVRADLSSHAIDTAGFVRYDACVSGG